MRDSYLNFLATIALDRALIQAKMDVVVVSRHNVFLLSTAQKNGERVGS